MKFFFSLFFLGCAVGQPIEDPQFINEPVSTLAVTKVPPSDYFKHCSFAFSPDQETRVFVETAVGRWSMATGCDIYVASWGLPVVAVDHIYREDGKEAAGVASYDLETGIGFLVQMSRTMAFHPYLVAAHEIGHILSYPLAGRESHTETGLMQPTATIDSAIDEASLTLICGGLECQEFSPERVGGFRTPDITF